MCTWPAEDRNVEARPERMASCWSDVAKKKIVEDKNKERGHFHGNCRALQPSQIDGEMVSQGWEAV